LRETPYRLTLGECRRVDDAAISRGIAYGTAAAVLERSDAATVRLAGLSITGEIDPQWEGVPLIGQYSPSEDRITFRCGEEWVLAHEIGHRIAYKLGVPCWDGIWHPVAYGSGTVNMNCYVVRGSGHVLGSEDEVSEGPSNGD